MFKLKTKQITEAVWRLSQTCSIGATATVPSSNTRPYNEKHVYSVLYSPQY